MSELLLELFSEEIPARMQGRAAADLEKAVNKALMDAGFMPEGVKGFAGPRRLTVVAAGVPARQPDRREEKKGPRVGAPDKAVEGFLKSAGLTSLDQCEQREDKKGAYWVAVIDQKGRDTADLIAEFVPEIVRGFSWPKSMRWGDGELKWVRPLHSILCVFDGEVVNFDIDGVKSGDKTQGHRFLAPGDIHARSFEAYAESLKKAKVILDAEERKEMIAGDAATLCKAQGLELVDDAGLLNEVSGLAEWPVAMMGSFDEKFLTVPDEVLTASMRGHQKYFSVRDPKTGRLANKFVYVANIESPDGGKAMRTGYERVLTARLSDAWYLYHQDLKRPLEARIEELDKVTFFEEIGTLGEKTKDVADFTEDTSRVSGADPAIAKRAALLAKADLVTGMVYEFPELQGVMGRYYALEQGESVEIADAIRDHYKPAGQDDEIPTAPVSVAVALADKIDTLAAFWTINKKPTGSNDPFALRRAVLGVIRLILHNDLKVSLSDLFVHPFAVYLSDRSLKPILAEVVKAYSAIEDERFDVVKKFLTTRGKVLIEEMREKLNNEAFEKYEELCHDLLSFFHERLKVYLRDKGHRHDHIDAVLKNTKGELEDDLVLIVSKLEALEVFLKTGDGPNLVAAYKRAANILRVEEKKDGIAVDPETVDDTLFQGGTEMSLLSMIQQVETTFNNAVHEENFMSAMSALSVLRDPIDGFFEDVKVNDENPKIRANRLALLAKFRDATAKVADFSKLEG